MTKVKKDEVEDDPSMLAVFDKLDKNKDGFISYEEFEDSLRNDLSTPFAEAEIRQFFENIDIEQDNKVSVTEFRTFFLKRNKHIRRLFDSLDIDSNGRLSSEEVKLAIQSLGMNVSSAQLTKIMNHIHDNDTSTKNTDTTNDITFDTFKSALLLLPSVNPEAVFEAYVNVDAAGGGEYTAARDARTEHGESKTNAILKQLYAGGIAGCVSRTCTAPLERVKMLVQAGRINSGLFPGLRQIYLEGGMKSFWRGNGANCIKVAPETGAKFVLFEQLKQIIAEDSGNVNIWERFWCGGMAGCGAQTLVYPLEVMKTRISIAPSGTYSGFLDCWRKTIRFEGVRALYKGLGASVFGIIPYAGVDLMINSMIRESAVTYYSEKDEEPGIVVLLGTGMVSSTCAMTISYPLNLVRTRLQASGMPHAYCYNGPIDCFQSIFRANGMRGLYRGFAANLSKVLPATSISYAVYDVLKNRK